MQLFYAPASSSLSPHIVLYEAGLPFEAVRINEHSKIIERGGDYRKINPLGLVPALALDDGTLVTEGAAIVQYIADKVSAKNLAPPNGTIERTKLQSWLNFLSSEMHKGGFSPLFYKGMPEEGKEVFRARLKARFAHLNEHFNKGNEFLIGANYSVADAHLFVISNWAGWVNFDLSPYPNVTSFRTRIGARISVRSALKAEGLIPWPNSPPG